MTLLAPVSLALAGLAVPIVVLYMLRTRRARTPVSSTFLWEPDTRPVAANAPWQPLRWSLLLVLQLLALALLVLTLARPARATATPLAEHTVLIVDTSGSMNARFEDRTRLDEAKRLALATVDRLPPGGRMSVIDAGPRAEVVVSSSDDTRALRDEIQRLRPSDGAADLASAFALGASLETVEHASIMHLFSDGAIPAEAPVTIPPGLIHVPVGADAGTVAVERVVVAARGTAWDAFVRMTNTTASPVDASLELRSEALDVLARRPVRLEPNDPLEIALPVAARAGSVITARLVDVRLPDGGDARDALATDDEARAVLLAGAGVRVLLVGPGNVFLESLVRSIPGAQLTVTKARASTKSYTLAIYDRVAPPAEAAIPSLMIASPSGAAGVRVIGERDHPLVTFSQPREPILAHVDVSRLAVLKAQRVRAPRFRALVAAGDDPLVAVGVPGGTRAAYVSFDLRESNLPVQVAFPLLFGNLIDWLAGGEPRGAASPVAGDPLPLRIPGGADDIEITLPDGTSVRRTASRALFDDTQRAGIYRVRYRAGDEVLGDEALAVNTAPSESDLHVDRLAASTPAPGRSEAVIGGVRALGSWLLLLVMAVLMAEWWLGHGRPTRARTRAAGRTA